jgi:adenosylcobinamide kinase/adenosylcobinamide-phosphate guanylyltransferase
MAELRVARSELILGGQKSGKTRRAENLAAVWLAQDASHRAIYIATAQAWDEEMRERIARHRMDRAQRVPRMETVEEPYELARAIGAHSRSDTLVVVDCLTLWLTARLMPKNPEAEEGADTLSLWERAGVKASGVSIGSALAQCAGPIILISNEIGQGVIPLGPDTRNFVDALGTLNQEAAAACERVTLMSAGIALTLKGTA